MMTSIAIVAQEMRACGACRPCEMWLSQHHHFHNGAATIWEAVRIMATAQLWRVIQDRGPAETIVTWTPSDRRLKRHTPATISENEIADIVAFLHALTSGTLAESTSDRA